MSIPSDQKKGILSYLNNFWGYCPSLPLEPLYTFQILSKRTFTFHVAHLLKLYCTTSPCSYLWKIVPKKGTHYIILPLEEFLGDPQTLTGYPLSLSLCICFNIIKRTFTFHVKPILWKVIAHFVVLNTNFIDEIRRFWHFEDLNFNF